MENPSLDEAMALPARGMLIMHQPTFAIAALLFAAFGTAAEPGVNARLPGNADGFFPARQNTARCGTRCPPDAIRGVYELNLWPNSTLYYEFHVSVSPGNRAAMLEAMAEISSVGDMQFVERTTETNFVFIRDFAGGYNYSSAIGMVGGQQEIGIQSWGMKFVMVHELFHALGVWHEQMRVDRNEYVEINSSNIVPGFAGNFRLVPNAPTNGPYDFDSIMHYDQFAFSSNGRRTITVLPTYQKRWQYRIGTFDRDEMSNGDIWVMTDLYGGSPPPRVVELTQPARGQLVGDDWVPTFTWSVAQEADDYRLLVDDDPDFASPEIDVTITQASYTRDSLLAPGKLYHWTVEARNAVGTSEPFLTGSFYTASEVPAILFVDDNAEPGSTGASWNAAIRDLQDALAIAENIAGGVTEIRVAQGTYRPGRGTGVRRATFDLVGGTAILGGYAGPGEPDPDRRDPRLYETILSGDLNGDDEPGFVNYQDNSYRVVFGLGADEPAVLDGVTITAGNANGTGFDSAFSGLLTDEGQYAVSNCIFESNMAIEAGGALSNAFDAAASISGCTFRNNYCEFVGGAVANAYAGDVTLQDCVFTGNSGGAGGATVNIGCAPTFVNCLFADNVAAVGGAMLNVQGGFPSILNCVFYGNSATAGGAIFSDDASFTGMANSISWNNGPMGVLGPGRVGHSCIQGGYRGTGNIDADPQFVDPDNMDLRLASGSPCIDVGWNGAVPQGVTLDLLGHARFIDDPATTDCTIPGTSCGTAPIVDLGPYEYVPSILGDFDLDLDVDLDDYTILAVCSAGSSVSEPPDGCSQSEFDVTDLDADSDVDLADFRVFQISFTGG